MNEITVLFLISSAIAELEIYILLSPIIMR